jgi:hypothetical protein
MKRHSKPGKFSRLDRGFWIATLIVTLIVVILTLLDAYYWGFR